jgi:hypothetical protein
MRAVGTISPPSCNPRTDSSKRRQVNACTLAGNSRISPTGPSEEREERSADYREKQQARIATVCHIANVPHRLPDGSDVHPNFSAIDRIAAHWEGYWGGCSRPCGPRGHAARGSTCSAAASAPSSRNGPSDQPGVVQGDRLARGGTPYQEQAATRRESVRASDLPRYRLSGPVAAPASLDASASGARTISSGVAAGSRGRAGRAEKHRSVRRPRDATQAALASGQSRAELRRNKPSRGASIRAGVSPISSDHQPSASLARC